MKLHEETLFSDVVSRTMLLARCARDMQLPASGVLELTFQSVLSMIKDDRPLSDTQFHHM